MDCPILHALRLHRAEGPAVCLAQPNGLGYKTSTRLEGPTVRPFVQASTERIDDSRGGSKSCRNPMRGFGYTSCSLPNSDDRFCEMKHFDPRCFACFRTTTQRCRSRTNTDACVRNTRSKSTNGMFGIERDKRPGRWPSVVMMPINPARWAGLGNRMDLRPERQPPNLRCHRSELHRQREIAGCNG